jgi:hypothetical protein
LGGSSTFCVDSEISILSEDSFAQNIRIHSIVFDSNSRLKLLPARAFSKCLHLHSIKVPKSVLAICEYCFQECKELATVSFEFPATIRRIDFRAFTRCCRLTSFTVPSSVSTLGKSVFEYCSKLSSVTFEAPSNLTDIPDGLFSHCEVLASLCLPDSVIRIAGSAFAGTSLHSLTARGFSTTGSLFMQFQKVVRCLGTPKSVVIPSTVREIGENAFYCVSSLVELSFEEGVERINSSAVLCCPDLKTVAFPASLVVIDERAFHFTGVCEVAFPAGSKLLYIGEEALSGYQLERICLPASVTEIALSAFFADVWRIVKFEAPPLFVMDGDLLCSPDSRTMLKCLSRDRTIVIPAHIEVIGKNACCSPETAIFASGSRLREIGEEAFSQAIYLSSITVPSSVEIIGDRCFESCGQLEIVTFEDISNLNIIGERSFASTRIKSFTIPASVNEIGGSAFADCPLDEIDIAPGNQRFVVSENTLLTSNWTEIVRYFGRERKICVPSQVEILQSTCFESLGSLTELTFESGSKLRKIGPSSLYRCDSLRCIVVPASVAEIGESAFKECIALENCSIHEESMLTRIGQEAFAGCCSLRSFSVPKNIEEIGENCFKQCPSLFRLWIESGETLKRIVRAGTLDEALGYLGFVQISSRFRIEVEEDVCDLSFPGWIPDADDGSPLILARDV